MFIKSLPNILQNFSGAPVYSEESVPKDNTCPLKTPTRRPYSSVTLFYPSYLCPNEEKAKAKHP